VTAFDQFVFWIYNQPLTVERTWVLAVTYTLADRFLMEGFKNAVVDRAMLEFQKSKIHVEGVLELCKNNLSRSALGRYFRNQLAFELIHLGFEAYITKYDCGEALVQLIQHKENLMTFTRVLDKARCAYRGGNFGILQTGMVVSITSTRRRSVATEARPSSLATPSA
jgi:hypothetical protein